ncbi:MAG TPA: hypothetical protein VMI75_17470 [Polyangiaceae bacterium]|nr:hypothetical protein [Polyangiaceae bacterium]
MNPVARETEHAVPILGLCAGVLLCGCGDAAHTYVSLDNHYPASKTSLVVYQGWWQAVPFSTPILPGGSSGPQPTVAASDNTAYVVLAPGWDPKGNAGPTSVIVMQSKTGFAVRLNDTLQIPVDDEHFAGNCLTGSHLTQQQADFITHLVFPVTFEAIRYDAATCTAKPIGDAAP